MIYFTGESVSAPFSVLLMWAVPIYIGESCEEKVERIREKMKEDNCSVLIATALDEVACECMRCSSCDKLYMPLYVYL